MIAKNYTLEHIARALKRARVRKRMSQRALSRLSGLQQSQISKIENGAVDLRITSLIELARALDLDLVLVPRHSLLAVQAIIRGAKRTAQAGEPEAARPAYSLHDEDEG